MPFVKVYIHFVWATKKRIPFLHTKELRKQVWTHMKENAAEKGIVIDHINGYDNHCHCLVSLSRDHTIQDIVKLIKGESSFWINKHQLTKEKFAWQTEYWAASVSERGVEKVRNYIRNQETHHSKQSFPEEHDAYLVKHGFERLEDNDTSG